MKQSAIALSLFLSLLLLGCSGGSAGGAKSGATKQGGSALVTTGSVVQKSMPVDIRVTGNVEEYTAIRVKAQVGGQLTKVNFEEGQDVKKGDLLFQIDPRPYDEAIRQVEANLARDTALFRQAQANLQRDIASQKFAEDQAGRYQKLFSEGVMSKQQADQYASDADSKGEGVKADQAAIESAQAAIGADTANLENAKLQRAYCDIRSPIEGRTGNVAIEEGNLLRTSDAELVVINQVHPIYVTFSVPETRLADVKKYMAAGKLEVIASQSDAPEKTETGTLTFVDNAVDSTTGMVKLKGTFPNADGRLWPGQFVNVLLRLTTMPNALVAPLKAVQIGPNGEYAYVIGKDMKVEMRPVVTGLKLEDEVVIEKGLQSGETVVTEGHLRIAPGMRVRTGTGARGAAGKGGSGSKDGSGSKEGSGGRRGSGAKRGGRAS
jgi:multidrug efflux system membrane fusion protein